MRLKLLLCSVLLISGCTTKFGYNNLDWLVHWFIDDYVDLNYQQREQFDDRMSQALDWHRSNELPKYRTHLVEIQTQVSSGAVSQQQWLGHLHRLRAHWWRTRDHFVEVMAPLGRQLSDEQVVELFYEMDNRDRERREERQALTVSELKAERLDELVERMGKWLGRLSESQLQMLEAHVDKHQSSFYLRMDYRSRVQQAASDLMVARFELADFESRLQNLLKNPQQYQGTELTELRAANRQKFAGLLAALTDSLSAYQRDHLIDELQGLINDVDDLMRGGKRAPNLATTANG